MPKVTNRCTGHCCRSFYLPYSPKELEAKYRLWQGSSATRFVKNGLKDNRGAVPEDIWLIYPMVEYLGMKQPFKKVNPSNDALLGRSDRGHYYSCKHFDDKAKKCTIYEIRPRICRDYPYGSKCEYEGCTWKKVRAMKETKAATAARKKGLLKEKRKLKGQGGNRS